jgi:hypothetical protein
VIGVLAGHPGRDEVRARLVEPDERNVAVARQAARAAGLDGVGCPGLALGQLNRHGEHDSVTVTIAEGFRSASNDLPILIRSDLRHS